MSVRQAQASMDAAEFAEWRAYDSIDPIGPERFDWLAASIAMSVLTPWTKKKLDVAEFVPKWDRGDVESLKRPKQTVEQMKAVLLGGLAASGRLKRAEG